MKISDFSKSLYLNMLELREKCKWKNNDFQKLKCFNDQALIKFLETPIFYWNNFRSTKRFQFKTNIFHV